MAKEAEREVSEDWDWKKEIMYILYKDRCHDCDHHGDDGFCDSSCEYKWDVLDKIEEILKKVMEDKKI